MLGEIKLSNGMIFETYKLPKDGIVEIKL